MGSLRFAGKVWIFGDNIETDALAPGKYLVLPIEEAATHCLETLNPLFPSEVRPGDIIVGGRNFGCGSSREAAPAALKHLGISVVLAASFGRIFFRNAIALGLPVLACPGIAGTFREGDTAEVDVAAATVRHLGTGVTIAGQPLSEEMLRVLEEGGVFPMIQRIAREGYGGHMGMAAPRL
ncbi:MAG: 3-isopropylmalate dehydratase [candidate division NC10 bacterium]|nr:3-isopropylmalate dehydratase [candidate division NC10 bacterium]MBI2561642.1 3-isopropylmalate dehydratase [candidate division NC10 bacterium]